LQGQIRATHAPTTEAPARGRLVCHVERSERSERRRPRPAADDVAQPTHTGAPVLVPVPSDRGSIVCRVNWDAVVTT
jgi:hypothetical protein